MLISRSMNASNKSYLRLALSIGKQLDWSSLRRKTKTNSVVPTLPATTASNFRPQTLEKGRKPRNLRPQVLSRLYYVKSEILWTFLFVAKV
mmetsp:Transcript_361/g.403  ORF Transcript_361/g.403 Transcript_361/m.403 type:complete len:91 (+) Transcript_361:773-1045(+)